MLGNALRILIVVVLTAIPLYIAATNVGITRWLALLLVLVVPWLLWYGVPRLAHRAYRRGNYNRAKLLYNLLRLWVLSKASRAHVNVSLTACALAAEDWYGALEQLDRIEPESLNNAARAAWLNNRAYALIRDERELHSALELSEEAIRLRPDVIGFRHTRGIALLALGREEEAITALEGLWDRLAADATEASPLLEAERCYDLGMAWRRKGEFDYARDYFRRAHRASPQSLWAMRSADYLDTADMSVLAEFLEA